MSKRKFWQFKNQAAGVGELHLYGMIGPDDGLGWLFDEVSPKAFKADLDALGDISQLYVYINSDGGDVFAGQAIHSMLKRHKAHVTVTIDGIAASIASVIAMAGDTIRMPRNAMMMVHNPAIGLFGDAHEHRRMADTLDQVRESIVAAYEEKTGMEHDELIALLDAETWMTATQAVEMGFADEIEEAKQIVASLVAPKVLLVNGQTVHLERFANPPSMEELGLAQTRPDPYTQQAEAAVQALAEYERRSLDRIAVRARAGKSLTQVDVQRWERIRDAAGRVLAQAAPEADPPAPSPMLDMEHDLHRWADRLRGSA